LYRGHKARGCKESATLHVVEGFTPSFKYRQKNFCLNLNAGVKPDAVGDPQEVGDEKPPA
jgi:hypothetical protein